MANDTATPNNYGQGLSDNGGGVYITEWTSAFVRVWFFGRDDIPSSVTDGSPDISEFGLPMANFQGSCDIDTHFANHSIIINTDFCGAWAGFAYSGFSECPLTPGASGFDSCVDFVGNNPQNFTQAYWEVNSIKVYQLPVNVEPSSVPTSTAPLSSASPISVSGSIINPGMGQSSSSIPASVPYTGPLSSVSSTVSSSSATALATPLICFPFDGMNWTDANSVNYTINCGYDLTGQSLNGNGQTVSSFEACIELCDGAAGCGGVTHLGGNGAGTCILKTGQGELEYDGHTFVAVLANLTGSAASSTVSSATATISLSSVPPKTATLQPTAQASTCPQANNAVYVDENVISYNVSCSSDTNIGTFNNTLIHGGGFTACMTICDVTEGCVGFTFEGDSAGTCHFKNQFGSPSPAPSDFVVAFLSQGPNSTSSASSGAAASSTVASSSQSSLASSLSAPATTSSATSSSSSSSSMSPVVSSSSSSSMSPVVSSSSSTTSISTSITSSASSPTVYYVAPPCPSSADDICNSNTTTTCSNTNGTNFNVGCGTAYTGTIIDTDRVHIKKRTTEPTYTDCLNLCADTSGCLGVNYKGDQCTMFSHITGTVPDPDNVSGAPLPPMPITSTSTNAATSSSTESSLSIFSSSFSPVSLLSTPPSSSAASSTSSAVSLSTDVPSCPGSTNQTYIDSNGANYTVACDTNVQGGDLSSPYRAASILGCLPSCDVTTGCIGVVYDTGSSSCQMKSTFTGTKVPSTGFMMALRAGAIDPGLSSSSSLMSSATASSISSSSATITITTCKYS
jgi:hypothetical protein